LWLRIDRSTHIQGVCVRERERERGKYYSTTFHPPLKCDKTKKPSVTTIMIASRCVRSSQVTARLSALSLTRSAGKKGSFGPCSLSSRSTRLFSGGGSSKKEGDHPKEDPFGVNYEDGSDQGNLGPSSELPPKYRRDTATGKFTGEIEVEVSDDERQLLHMDDLEKERALIHRLVEQWQDSETTDTGESVKQAELARRIREEEMAMNTFGRSPPPHQDEDGQEVTAPQKTEQEDEEGFSKPLTPQEFKSFREYMKKAYDADITKGDIPVQDMEGGHTHTQTQTHVRDNPDLDLTWMSASAQRATDDDDAGDHDPFLDLMPSDFNPARLVNRRRAKLIPRELLHQNNLSLLRRYVTPGGAIMNRVQSRLGAKDQRKMAKMIKRARHLGFIPYMGQWKFENHGSIHEQDIHEEKEWEQELIRRGLVKRTTKTFPPKDKESLPQQG